MRLERAKNTIDGAISAGQTEVALVGRSVPFTVEDGQSEINVHVKVVFTRYPLERTIEQAGATVTCANVNASTAALIVTEDAAPALPAITFSVP